MVDVAALRDLLNPVVGAMKDMCTNSGMPEYCRSIGLPPPPDAPSKRERMYAAFDALPDDGVPIFAQGLIDNGLLPPRTRNEVQDVLWAGQPGIEIPKRHRREIARALNQVPLFHHWLNFSTLLRNVFVLEEHHDFLLGVSSPLDDIHRHFVEQPEHADVEQLFEQLHVFELSDHRFADLLEGLAGADVQVDAAAQLVIVNAVNPVLQTCAAELRHVGERDGYPVYRLASTRAARGKPKNLIFASHSKPDIRIRDAVDNDIEIVSNADDVLVYDRPLGVDGLPWRALQAWWADKTGEPDPNQAKKTLYRRLLDCLPQSSPPQRLLFESFYRGFGSAVPNLPALLPEVWLHWDPKTVRQRGAQALLNHRMDFLLLLRGGARVVVEVDGKQHYADAQGRADSSAYARLVAGDRDLRLAGYEVYRFAGAEIQDSAGAEKVTAFFTELFKQHGIEST